MKKKISILLIFLVILIQNALSVSATDSEKWNNIWDVSEYTDEEIGVAIEKDMLSYKTYLDYKNDLSNTSKVSARIMPVTNTYTIPVTNFIQEKTNWCGPACVRQTLSFHSNKATNSFSLPSQTEIAKKLNVYGNSKGSSSADIASTLNFYLSKFNVSGKYISTDINDKSNPSEWLYSTLKNEIKAKTYAPIVLVDTNDPNGLAQYTKYNERIRHYNTISGVQEVVDANLGKIVERNICRVDPHYKKTFSGSYWEVYTNLYSCVSYADSHGPNKILIY